MNMASEQRPRGTSWHKSTMVSSATSECGESTRGGRSSRESPKAKKTRGGLFSKIKNRRLVDFSLELLTEYAKREALAESGERADRALYEACVRHELAKQSGVEKRAAAAAAAEARAESAAAALRREACASDGRLAYLSLVVGALARGEDT